MKNSIRAAVITAALGLTLTGCMDPDAPDNIQDDIAKYTRTPDRTGKRETLKPSEAVPQPLTAPSSREPSATPSQSRTAKRSSEPTKAPATRVKPREAPAKTQKPEPRAKAPAPSNTRIVSTYVTCTYRPQPCLDRGSLTYYENRILAGHAHMGYSWLSSLPTGSKLRITTGPLKGTYYVYGHMTINRRSGSLPSFGEADLVGQSCVGTRSTGFSLMRRV